jgi:ATP-dependent HslUV protease subunit HslV
MTIICWRDGILAADSLMLMGSFKAKATFKKIRYEGNGQTFACTGTAALFEPMIAWIKAGAKPGDVPKPADRHCDTRVLLFENGRCFSYTPNLPYPDEQFAPDAWGSEAEFALGAMAAGATAEEAVALAIENTNTVGGPIEVIDLHQIEQIKTRAA